MSLNSFVAHIFIWVVCGYFKGTSSQADENFPSSESLSNELISGVTALSLTATSPVMEVVDSSNITFPEDINSTSENASFSSMFVTLFNLTNSSQEITTPQTTSPEPTTTTTTTTTPVPTTTTEATTTTTTTTTTMPTTVITTTTPEPTTVPTTEDTTLQELTTTEEPTEFIMESSSTVKTTPTESQPETSNSSANYTQSSIRECSVVGETLICHDWMKCFGEGEIDCDILEQNKESKMKEKYMESELANGKENDSKKDRKVEVTIHRLCKLSGPLQCIPHPSTSKCRGKGKCNPVSEMSANESVEDWIIAVICISIGLGLFLLVILVYVTYASWKKLRVQPQLASSTSYVPGQTA